MIRINRHALIGVLVLSFTVLVHAADSLGQSRPDAGDSREIRQVIRTQLNAFLREDGKTAFGQAAPVIRLRFGTAENFMAMVRSGYRPVYRARDVRFGRLGRHRGRLIQEVRLTGPDGRRWTALYSMERQPDGSWRISGCRLVQPTADI